MRLERSHPWGFDTEDPRLELRRAAAEAQVTEMCRKLLANQVIEDFRFEINELATSD